MILLILAVLGVTSDGHGVLRSFGLLRCLVIPLILSVFSDHVDSYIVWC